MKAHASCRGEPVCSPRQRRHPGIAGVCIGGVRHDTGRTHGFAPTSAGRPPGRLKRHPSEGRPAQRRPTPPRRLRAADFISAARPPGARSGDRPHQPWGISRPPVRGSVRRPAPSTLGHQPYASRGLGPETGPISWGVSAVRRPGATGAISWRVSAARQPGARSGDRPRQENGPAWSPDTWVRSRCWSPGRHGLESRRLRCGSLGALGKPDRRPARSTRGAKRSGGAIPALLGMAVLRNEFQESSNGAVSRLSRRSSFAPFRRFGARLRRKPPPGVPRHRAGGGPRCTGPAELREQRRRTGTSATYRWPTGYCRRPSSRWGCSSSPGGARAPPDGRGGGRGPAGGRRGRGGRR